MAKHSKNNKGTSPSLHRLIPCRVEPGMFRDEFLVHLDVLDPQDPNRTISVELLVDQREVKNLGGKPQRNQPVKGWLRVAFARKERGFVHLVLPQPATPGGENILVDESGVKEEAGV